MREMKNWNEDIVKEVFDRALAQCDFLKEKNPEVWNNLEKYAHNNASIMGKQYEYHGKIRRNSFPCPLLNPETKACMVYDSRPIICRSHGTAHVNAHKHSNTEICEFIPESKQHAKQTPSVDHEQEEALSFINMKTPDGEIAHLRTYPIYYWFKIIYERTGEKKAQYNHYDDTVNFDRPIKQADYYTLKGFNTI
ncbi:Putative zinc-or iron-chelating domain-containing protein [Lentibacillus halodurans]|uniref:Putative zinc-or iron-chelating domain-containing protein n=1 Tax=Lentibacillus halodurans TaxID=237679 RepID=A0A1I1AES4_9BACI|nr:YkgJ family cysteine cluster protein [Lentibacillus halodurans]SFB36457.1 Putative zinc-or iron-chelating domain-containing protein [Lentibacillus halodurans]